MLLTFRTLSSPGRSSSDRYFGAMFSESLSSSRESQPERFFLSLRMTNMIRGRPQLHVRSDAFLCREESKSYRVPKRFFRNLVIRML